MSHAMYNDKMIRAVSAAAAAMMRGEEFNFDAAAETLSREQLNGLALEAFTARVNKVLSMVHSEFQRAAA